MKFVVLTGLLLVSTSFAQKNNGEGSKNEAQAIIEKLSRAHDALKESVNSPQNCVMPETTSCTFESYCSQLSERGANFYLYQDSEGHQIPNFQYVYITREAELCSKKFPKTASEDPFVYFEKFKLPENKGVLDKSTKRVQGIFEEVRAGVLKVLESRRNSSNSAEIDNMISRVKVVRFNAVKPENINQLATEGCESANAFFNPAENNITVCPQLLNMPEAALFATLGHEFAHSVDPCTMSFDMTKTGDVIPKWLYEHASRNKWLYEKSDYNKSPVLSRAVSLAKNPYASVISCLQTSKSINAKIPTLRELQDEAQGVQRTTSSNGKVNMDDDDAQFSGGNEDQPPEAVEPTEDGDPGGATDAKEAAVADRLKTLNDHYDRYKACSLLTDNGHIGEAFADWIGTQTLANKIASLPDPAKAKEYAFASQGVFLGNLCPQIGEAAMTKVAASIKNCQPLKLIALNMMKAPSDQSHPQTSKRMNRLIMANPQLKQALGCQGGDNAEECK